MTRYGNLGGDSNVLAFETGPDSITVMFSGGARYLYTSASAGLANIEHMKRLAVRGHGLNAFINQNVKKRYARRLS